MYNFNDSQIRQNEPQLKHAQSLAFNDNDNPARQNEPQLKHARSFASNTNEGQPLMSARSFESNNSWGKNSWAGGRSNNLHNSWGPANAHQSAMVPPLFVSERTASENKNSVPPPPTGTNYQPTTPLSDELGFVEKKLHFHVDTIYQALRRLIIDGNDKVIDEVIKRTEKIEERVDKSFRGTSRHFHEVQEEVKQTLNRHMREIHPFIPTSQQTLARMNNMEDKMEDKMEGLGNGVQNIGNNMSLLKDRISNLQDRVANLGDQMRGLTMQVNGALSTPRIASAGSSGSAYYSNRRESNQSQQGGPQQGGRARGGSQRREGPPVPTTPRRSTGSQQRGLRRFNNTSIDTSDSRRGQYEDFGRTHVPEPDITMHPAYATNQQELGSTSPAKSTGIPQDEENDDALFPKPQFSNGSWFTHAHSQE